MVYGITLKRRQKIMSKEDKKSEIEQLQAQVEGLNKLVNHYANKCMQLENQLVLSQDDQTPPLNG